VSESKKTDSDTLSNIPNNDEPVFKTINTRYYIAFRIHE